MLKYIGSGLTMLLFVSNLWGQNEDDYQVGILVMDGVYNTELTAPYDIFHHTLFREGVKPMEVFLVSEDGGTVTTFEGIELLSDHDFDSAPELDILVIPAAEGHLGKDLKNERLLSYIGSVMKQADYVLTLCDGAFLLAAAGLPKGTNVTTFPGDIDEFEHRFSNLDVHRDVLFVHDGRFITGAGGARSFEPALYLCELLYGKEVAEQLAKGMVIEWDLEEIKYFRR